MSSTLSLLLSFVFLCLQLKTSDMYCYALLCYAKPSIIRFCDMMQHDTLLLIYQTQIPLLVRLAFDVSVVKYITTPVAVYNCIYLSIYLSILEHESSFSFPSFFCLSPRSSKYEFKDPIFSLPSKRQFLLRPLLQPLLLSKSGQNQPQTKLKRMSQKWLTEEVGLHFFFL